MAANLREALRTVPMLSESYGRVLVMVDSPVLQVPADEFKEDLAETYYNHSFTSQQQQKVLYTVCSRVYPAQGLVYRDYRCLG